MEYKYKTIPYRQQEIGYNYLYGKEAGALFMEQGTGKTKTAIDIVSNLYLEGKINAVMLIAPNAVHAQWANEQLPEHSPVHYQAFVWNSSNKTKGYQKQLNYFIDTKLNALKWFCINIDAFSYDTYLILFKGFLVKYKTAIIVDECTGIKNKEAARTYNICYRLGELIKRGRSVVGYRPYSLYRYILTGTMVTNSPFDLYTMMEFLQYNFWGCNIYAFKARYGLQRRDTSEQGGKSRSFTRLLSKREIVDIRNRHLNGEDSDYLCNFYNMSHGDLNYIVTNKDLDMPIKNLGELKEIIKPYAFTVRKKECTDIPDKIYMKVPVELSKDQARVYKELKKKYITEYSGQALTVQNKLTLAMRLSQITGGFFPCDDEETAKAFTSNAKLKVMERELQETSGQAIIIFAAYVNEIKAIKQMIDKKFPDMVAAEYYGAVPVKDRDKIKTDFMSGKIDVLVANLATAGVGLNLQRSSLMFFYSNNYSSYYREQGEDRAHRIGQINNLVIKDLVTVGTVDEVVYQALMDNKDLLAFFRDIPIEEFIK
jgi:SNF2 family DNA or RNA helicase